MGLVDNHGRDKTTSILKLDAHQERDKWCPYRSPRLLPDEVLSALTRLRTCPSLTKLGVNPDQHHMGNSVIAPESRGGPPNTFDICQGCLWNFRRAQQMWPWCTQSTTASGLHCHDLSHPQHWLSYLPQLTRARETGDEAVKVYVAWNNILPCPVSDKLWLQPGSLSPPQPSPTREQLVVIALLLEASS